MIILKRAALAAALFFTLTAGMCDSGSTGTVGKDALAKIIKVAVETGCNVSPSVIDIATSLGGAALPGGVIAAPLVNTFAKNYAKQVCDQWKAKQSTHALVDDGCVATVNGVCIHKE